MGESACYQIWKVWRTKRKRVRVLTPQCQNGQKQGAIESYYLDFLSPLFQSRVCSKLKAHNAFLILDTCVGRAHRCVWYISYTSMDVLFHWLEKSGDKKNRQKFEIRNSNWSNKSNIPWLNLKLEKKLKTIFGLFLYSSY